MPTTSNFGWTTPADTDYVKDGALAIRTLGNGIDTSLVDLKGGTTGQILSKASNTDLDYTWINNDQGDITNVGVTAPITGGGSSGSVTIGIDDASTAQKGAVQLEDSTSSTSITKAATPNSVKSAYDLANAAIPKSIIDAEGDLIVGDAADAVQRLAVGTTGQVLTVDTGIDGKLKWATPAAGGKVLQVVSASTTTATTIASASLTDTGITATITPSATNSKILVLVTSQFAASRATTNVYINAALKRSTTTIADYPGNNYAGYNIGSGTAYLHLTQSIAYVDSPSTTSATTYKLQAAVETTANSAQVVFQNSSSTSSIVLLEIGA